MFRFRKSATATAWPCEAPGSKSKPNTQSSRLLIVSPAGSAATQKWPRALSFATKRYCPRSVIFAPNVSSLSVPQVAGLRASSRPASARQQPPQYPTVRITAAAVQLVLLGGLLGERRGLFCGLSLVLRKRHPLANDPSARLLVFHVRGSLHRGFTMPGIVLGT